MKSIYNILIIGILCLLSTTASAQFEQLTSPPGKTTGIPEKTGTAIDCSCNYPDDYLRLLAIIDQFEGEARLEKLREQEEALKTTIEDRYGRTFDNFNEAQRAMFETSFVKPTDKRILNDLSKQLDTDIDRGQTKVDNQRHERQVLSFRNNTSDLAQFGDLRISGDTPLKIREMTPSQITSKLNTLENDLSISESFTRKRLRQQDGIRKISASGAFTTRMIDDHVNHYNSFSFEDRIKVMTKYMILARGFSIADADALRFAPVPLDASTIDYTEIAEEMAFDAGTPVPVDVSTISNDEAKALYSLGYMGPKIYQGVVENQSLLSVYRKYIESQKYDGQWLDIASNTFTTMFIRDGYPAIIPDQFAATNGMPLLQDRDNREMALSFQAERPDLRGLGNFLGSVFAISNARNAEGSIMRDMFIHNGLTVHQDIPNWQLGDIFDFTETPLTTGDYHIQINFEAGIGIQLLQSGQAIETILQNPTIAEAGALYANGENKEERLQFFITVTSLAAQLNLSTEQRDLLVDNRQVTLGLEEFIDYNTPENGELPTNLINASQEILDILQEAEINAFEQTLEVIRTIEQFPNQDYPRADVMRDINRMNRYLRGFGYRPLAEYLDTIIPTLPSFSNEELRLLHRFVYEQTTQLKAEYFNAITGEYINGVGAIAEVILFEFAGNMVITMLERLPAVLKTAEILKIITNLKSISNFGALKYAKRFGINTFAELETLFINLGFKRTELGVQFHHLIEQRFLPQMKSILGNSTSTWKSIVLTVEEHQAFTKAWRKAIGYGNTPGTTGFFTSNAPREVIEAVARDIYKNYPEILKALGL